MKIPNRIIYQKYLIFPGKCTVQIKNKIYDSQKHDTIRLRLKLPGIDLNEKLIEEI